MLNHLGPLRWLHQLIDFFIKNDRYVNPTDLYRARILVGSLLTIAITCFLVSCFLLFRYFQEPHAEIGMLLTAGFSVLYALYLVIFRIYGNITFMAHSLVAPLYIGLIFSAFVSGGPLATSSQILFLIPLVVFFTAGNRAGLVWFLLVFVSQVIIYTMYWNGYKFVSLMTHAQFIEQSLVHWIITLVGILGVTTVYEGANQRLISQRQAEGENNRYLSQHDLLTGVKNRTFFEQKIGRQLMQGEYHRQRFALLHIDIRHFRQINQQFGFRAGDRILVEFAQRLTRLALDGDVARIDGNRFAMIYSMPSSDRKDVDHLCEMILASCSQPFSVENDIATLNIGIGYSLFPDHGNSLDALTEAAEDATEEAKHSPFCFTCYQPKKTGEDLSPESKTLE